MNGVHDLGGTDGMGPVVVPENEPVWRAEWEKAAFALFATNFRAGLFGVDAFRYGIEQMPPAEYLTSPYYEHWVHTAEHYAVQGRGHRRGRAGRADPVLPGAPRRAAARPQGSGADGVRRRRGEARRVGPPRVGQGSGLRGRRPGHRRRGQPEGHTRKARYVRGRTGVIEMAHGTFIYPDSAGNGGGDAPEHVYTVKFTNAELWGADYAEPNGVVYFDVWEPYIVHATDRVRSLR